jgi:hypothetical protein
MAGVAQPQSASQPETGNRLSDSGLAGNRLIGNRRPGIASPGTK